MTDFNSFLTEKGGKECTSMDECMRMLATDLYDYTSFRSQYRVPVPVQKNPYLTVSLHGETFNRAHMVSEIESNVDYSMWIGGREYEPKQILSLYCVWHSPYIRIDLTQPNLPDEIVVSAKSHYFSSDIRNAILGEVQSNGILAGEIVYAYGMATPLPEWLAFVNRNNKKDTS